VTGDPIRAIADAVLYEGYVLWPYRRSALKNAQRWTFGGVYPRAHALAREAGDDPWTMQTQCLVEGDSCTEVSLGVRFLHVVWRQLVNAHGHDVDELLAGGELHLTWEEAVEREVTLDTVRLDELRAGIDVPIAIEAGATEEQLGGAGAVVRSWEPLQGCLLVRTEKVAAGLHRLTARIENATPWDGGPREAAMRRTFCSTHTVLRVHGGSFVSLTDPPAALRDAAQACQNQGTWPVLVGETGEHHTLLSSPIILEDHPRIAPESPGDLFDGGEIDQLLILNIMNLTDEEKAEVRASDPRTRELLDRSEELSPEQLMRLHGRTVRELQTRPPMPLPGLRST
jgi:hydrogenase maturation protease